MEKREIESIKQNHCIVDVVEGYVKLQKSGSEYKACCPFHNEKTPSFTVSPDKQFYHCFGCGANGDSIDFVMKINNCEFNEAASILGGGKAQQDPKIKKLPARSKVGKNPYVDYTPAVSSEKITPGERIGVINPKRDGAIWNLTPSMVHEYPGQGYVLRIDKPDGGKITPMVRWCNGPQGAGWHSYPFDEPRPLYGLRDSGQVLIVEGEKTADAVASVCKRLNVVTWAGGANGAHKTDWSSLTDRSVIIWPDNDEPGKQAAQKIESALTSAEAESVKIITPPADLPKGWDAADKDWKSEDEIIEFCKSNLATTGPEPKKKPQLKSVKLNNPPPDWQAQLMFKNSGAPEANVNNAMLMLAYHDDMRGVLKYNSFAMRCEVCKAPPWETETHVTYPRYLSDIDDTRATAWLERMRIKLSISVVHHAILSASHHNAHHPLLDYLNRLVWDGTPRLDDAFRKMFACDDNEYTRAISKKYLISAAARALTPGCKADTMLILEGQQGISKSTALETLFSADFFTDELDDFGGQTAGMQVQGVWCIEVGELSAMSRADVARVKEWIPRRVDRFRMPYGRNLVEEKRGCVLAGTVNPDGVGYLQDASGGRRFWPVECHQIDLDWITENRDQLWAEAVVKFKEGEQWWLTNEEEHLAKEQQELRHDQDLFLTKIESFVGMRKQVTVSEIVIECLDIPSAQQSKAISHRIGKILHQLGFKQKQRRVNGSPARMFERE